MLLKSDIMKFHTYKKFLLKYQVLVICSCRKHYTPSIHKCVFFACENLSKVINFAIQSRKWTMASCNEEFVQVSSHSVQPFWRGSWGWEDAPFSPSQCNASGNSKSNTVWNEKMGYSDTMWLRTCESFFQFHSTISKELWMKSTSHFFKAGDIEIIFNANIFC